MRSLDGASVVGRDDLAAPPAPPEVPTRPGDVAPHTPPGRAHAGPHEVPAGVGEDEGAPPRGRTISLPKPQFQPVFLRLQPNMCSAEPTSQSRKHSSPTNRLHFDKTSSKCPQTRPKRSRVQHTLSSPGPQIVRTKNFSCSNLLDCKITEPR